jgi:hypothetical protein
VPDAVSRARRLLPVLPALLLLAVAGAQLALARRALLSPWKGGGFGMFSTLDARPYRYVRIYVEASDRSEELRVPASLEEEATAAEILPTPRNLARLAHAIAERESARGRPVETVSVELWRAEYETESLAATARKLLDDTWRAPR